MIRFERTAWGIWETRPPFLDSLAEKSVEWKFIQDFKKEESELYNLRFDASETKDAKKGHPAIASDLHERIQAHRKEKSRLPAPMVKAEGFSEKDLEKFRAMGYRN